MDEASEFTSLLKGLQAGNPDAVAAAYERYGPFLRAAVRRQMPLRLRDRFDSLDFVQDVWASVLALPLERYEFSNPNALIAFLQQVAAHKVIEVVRRRFSSEKDQIRRERTFADRSTEAPPVRSPTPSQLAIADEEMERLLAKFPPGHRTIILRLRDGYSIHEIAHLTHVSRSTVNRVVRRLKDLVGV